MDRDIFLEPIMLYHPLLEKVMDLPTGAVSGFCSMLFKLLEDQGLMTQFTNQHILQ